METPPRRDALQVWQSAGLNCRIDDARRRRVDYDEQHLHASRRCNVSASVTPFVRPFRWSRLLYTYIVPLIPFMVLFDGIVSFLRLYSADELAAIVASVPGQDTYHWDIGGTPILGLPVTLGHFVGLPKP